MSLVSALRKVTSKSFKAFGGDVTIRKNTAGTYNKTTGKLVSSTSDTTVKGLVSAVTNREVNSLIQAEDKICEIAAKDLTYIPTPKDRVVISSVVYKIIEVKTEERENTPISYKLFLRS